MSRAEEMINSAQNKLWNREISQCLNDLLYDEEDDVVYYANTFDIHEHLWMLLLTILSQVKLAA